MSLFTATRTLPNIYFSFIFFFSAVISYDELQSVRYLLDNCSIISIEIESNFRFEKIILWCCINKYLLLLLLFSDNRLCCNGLAGEWAFTSNTIYMSTQLSTEKRKRIRYMKGSRKKSSFLVVLSLRKGGLKAEKNWLFQKLFSEFLKCCWSGLLYIHI